MAKTSTNIHAYADSNYAVWTAPYGTAAPATYTGAPAGFYEVGLLSDAGVVEGHNFNETQVFDMAGSLVRILRSQEARTFTFSALESNPVVYGLLYPGTTISTTGATAEVQTVTITGTPTGGTFNLTLPGYGSATGLAYNITTAALATALSAAWGITVTVTGTAGTSYVITFPTTAGDVPTISASSALTGGTTPTVTVAVTTPGVAGTNTRNVTAGTNRNLRAWAIDVVDGVLKRRFILNAGEAVQSGDITYTASGLAEYQFTLTAFKDSNGYFYTILDNDSAQAGTFA